MPSVILGWQTLPLHDGAVTNPSLPSANGSPNDLSKS